MFVNLKMKNGKVEYINKDLIRIISEQDGKLVLLLIGDDTPIVTDEPFDVLFSRFGWG